MASEQARRENVTGERNIEVEKDRVSKMASHFETLAEKTKGEQDVAHPLKQAEKVTVVETVPVSGGGGGGIHRSEEIHGKGGGEVGRQGPSLEEISKMRGMAQQNSMEAIRAAEERYQQAKESGGLAAEKAKHSAMEKSQQDYMGQKAGDVKGGAWKDTAVEKGQQAKDYTTQKAAEAKDVISSRGGALLDTATEAKDVIASKGGAMRDTVMEKSQQAKDYSVEKGQTAAQIAAEKAKDVTVESGKGAGKVASGVKDQAVVEATKMAAGFTGDKAVAAKDMVAVVSSEENAAARKKASSHQMEEGAIKDGHYGTHEPPFQGGTEYEQTQQHVGGGIIQAIGETLVEIGQTTKELVAGQYPGGVKEDSYKGGEGI